MYKVPAGVTLLLLSGAERPINRPPGRLLEITFQLIDGDVTPSSER